MARRVVLFSALFIFHLTHISLLYFEVDTLCLVTSIPNQLYLLTRAVLSVWKKVIHYGNMTTAMEILSECDPVAIRHAGDRLKGSKSWEEIAVEVLQIGVTAKFKQNSHLVRVIKSTMKRSFLECNAYDGYWGIGVSLKEASSSRIIKSRGKTQTRSLTSYSEIASIIFYPKVRKTKTSPFICFAAKETAI